MSWQAEFRDAVALVVLTRGRPVSPRDLEDGWRDPWTYGNFHPEWEEIGRHRKAGCLFTATGEVTTVSWSAFTDTYAPNEDRQGLQAVASCACGDYVDIPFVYEGTLGEVIQAVLAIPPQETP